MQRLPDVVTTAGALALPLCGGTAWRLAAALVAGDGGRCDASLLRDALARDPALAIWALAQARTSDSPAPQTVDGLAAWLATAAVNPWTNRGHASSEALGGEALEPWVSLATRSIDIARRAAEIACEHGLEEHRAYLLGLAHLAPRWLAAARHPEPAQGDVLPAWLRDDLQRIGHAPGAIAGPADCVAAALHGAAQVDTCALAAELAAVRDDWSRAAGADLLVNLAAKLTRLGDLEQNFQRTLETEKLESLKELAYGAGHEINNPLANISARAQTLLKDERDPDRRRMLASINAQAFRAHEMIADMMLFARPPATRPEPFDIRQLVAALCEELGGEAAEQQTQLVVHAPDVPVPVTADKTQIAVALRSLCVNALEALVGGGRVEIAIAEPAPGDEQVRITVSDNGPGIPPEARRHLFDPFYSGREAGRGLGLGLSKCWRIVTLHRGQVEVASAAGRGAVFTVTLPASTVVSDTVTLHSGTGR